MTMKKKIEGMLKAFDDNTQFCIVAYELLHDGQSWSVNTPFTIGRHEDKEETIEIALNRWEVFKANYMPKARVKDIEDTSYEEKEIELECSYVPFLRIEAHTLV